MKKSFITSGPDRNSALFLPPIADKSTTTTTTRAKTTPKPTLLPQTTEDVQITSTYGKGVIAEQRERLLPCVDLEQEGIYWLATGPGELSQRSCPYGMTGL